MRLFSWYFRYSREQNIARSAYTVVLKLVVVMNHLEDRRRLYVGGTSFSMSIILNSFGKR